MKSALLTAVTLLAVSFDAYADETPPPPPPPAAAAEPAPTPPAAVVDDALPTTIGIHVGLNLGLFSVDAQAGHFYGFIAGNAGIPLVSNGNLGSVVAGVGYTFALTQGESRWMMDVLGIVPVGWMQNFSTNGRDIYGGAGVGVGFRYLHRSGFTLGFKVPVFGFTLGTPVANAGGSAGATSVGLFYLANAISLPVVSFGFRF
ncbi:MAG: hypothetical protein JNK82_15425 [Myxococcaceae bacterium]|nr:hypothetical protein [Myxococcaceae bacterium]